MTSFRDNIVDIAALLAAGTTILIGVRAVTMPTPEDPFNRSDQEVEDFAALVDGGHRRGAVDPILTIVEFGDYECPACRAMAPRLDSFVVQNPAHVALVYRHWPLNIHPMADDAARAAECAGYQGLFWPYHDALYRLSTLEAGSFREVAEEVGVPDRSEFESCQADPARTPQIAEDIRAAEALDGIGTPTLVINGIHLGSVPSRGDLDARLEEALAEGGG